MTAPIKTNRKGVSATLSIAAAASARLRIPRVAIAHPELCGRRDYLRALRAAEMAAWEAGLPTELAVAFARTVARTESN